MDWWDKCPVRCYFNLFLFFLIQFPTLFLNDCSYSHLPSCMFKEHRNQKQDKTLDNMQSRLRSYPAERVLAGARLLKQFINTLACMQLVWRATWMSKQPIYTWNINHSLNNFLAMAVRHEQNSTRKIKSMNAWMHSSSGSTYNFFWWMNSFDNA